MSLQPVKPLNKLQQTIHFLLQIFSYISKYDKINITIEVRGYITPSSLSRFIILVMMVISCIIKLTFFIFLSFLAFFNSLLRRLISISLLSIFLTSCT